MVFDDNGGTMGRAGGNDWVLPDPERHLSGRHAAVYLKDGDWYLADTSSNGVFVNESTNPVGPDQPVLLNNGDTLLLGDYEVVAEIDATGSSASLAPMADPLALGASLGDVGSSDSPMPDNLDPLALLSGGSVSPAPAAPSAPPIPPARPPGGSASSVDDLLMPRLTVGWFNSASGFWP